MSLIVNIQKKFTDFSLDVSFENDGETLGFLGASGCGKSLTLKCITGIIKPDKGYIKLNDKVLFDSEKGINLPVQKRKIGYMFQNYALFPNMTVLDNVICGLCREEKGNDKKKMAMDTLLQLGVEDCHRKKPHELSGGQQQRVALARILVNKPELLLFDEPFSALDSHIKFKLENELVNTIRELDKDAILVSHNRDEIYHICDRVAIYEKGKIINLGTVKEVFDNPSDIESARITGCKNIFKASYVSAHRVFLPELGIELESLNEVLKNIKAVGIRAHSFKTDCFNDNYYDVFVNKVIEEQFEYLINFGYDKNNNDKVWFRISKEIFDGKEPSKLGVKPKDILLLY